jgi:hypothetical protein
LLPAITADRVTGEPLKYRLIDNKPVVYSVGAGRIDDGGRPCYSTTLWGDEPGKVPPRGQWVLHHLDRTPGAALPVDHLPALFGAHAGAETDTAGTLYLAGLVGVMHLGKTPSLTCARRETSFRFAQKSD